MKGDHEENLVESDLFKPGEMQIYPHVCSRAKPSGGSARDQNHVQEDFPVSRNSHTWEMTFFLLQDLHLSVRETMHISTLSKRTTVCCL